MEERSIASKKTQGIIIVRCPKVEKGRQKDIKQERETDYRQPKSQNQCLFSRSEGTELQGEERGKGERRKEGLGANSETRTANYKAIFIF